MTTQSFRAALYAQESDEVFVALLTITSPVLSEPIYVSSEPYELLPTANVKGIISNGIEFIFIPFDIILPRDDATGTVSAKLTIDNIDREVIETIRSIRKPATVKTQVVLASDPDEIEMQFDNFRLSNVSYDAQKVEGDLTLEYWGLEPFPSGRFTPAGFPGLF